MKDSLNHVLKLAGTLLLITALVAAALAGVNSITAPRIAAETARKTQEAVNKVLPGGGELLEKGSYDDQNGLVTNVYASESGYAVEVTPAGFDGAITMMVGVNTAGEIVDISVISHTETAGLGAVAAADSDAGNAFRDAFKGLTGNVAVTKDGGTVEAITGATVTSRAVCVGVQAALDCVAGLG